MNVDVLWLSNHDEILTRGYADQGLLEAVLDRTVWTPPDAVTFVHHEIRDEHAVPDVAGAVVVFNARTHASTADVAWLKRVLSRLGWAVVLICGDEEWVFPWRELNRGNRRVWAMQPRPEHAKAGVGLLPGGWYPGTPEMLTALPYEAERPLDWFFAGQVTHERRTAMADAFATIPGGECHATDRYLAEAIDRPAYFERLRRAKLAPCPSGPYSVDCARAFEALEAGCVPLLDLRSAFGPEFDYWTMLFGPGHPFPMIADWADAPGMVDHLLYGWLARSNACFAAWQGWKRQLALDLERDVRVLAGTPAESDAPAEQISVVVTSSPCEVHPSAEHLFATIDSVRAQLPGVEVIVGFDGVRPEQEHLRDAYEEYQAEALWRINQMDNVVPVRLDEWGHQSGVLRACFELVERPLVFFMEHDTPIEGEIDWVGMCGLVRSGEANVVRLHIADQIHPAHEALMLDHETRMVGGVPVRRSAHFWARPHLALTEFYRSRILPRLLGRTYMEDVIYPELATGFADAGTSAWKWWRVFVYTPEGSMLRSLHLDSRGSEPKYPQYEGMA